MSQNDYESIFHVATDEKQGTDNLPSFTSLLLCVYLSVYFFQIIDHNVQNGRDNATEEVTQTEEVSSMARRQINEEKKKSFREGDCDTQ